MREGYYADHPYKKIVGSTMDQQWMRAQRGVAERLLFRGDEVLLNAGEPIYFARAEDDAFIGPSFSKRNPELRTWGDLRESIAHGGWAFGIEEMNDPLDGADTHSLQQAAGKIEVFVERHRVDGAALACARAVVRHLLWRARLPSACGARIARRYSGLLSEIQDFEMIEEALCRRMLTAMLAAEPGGVRGDLVQERDVAKRVLMRMEELSPPPLDEKDDEALAALGS